MRISSTVNVVNPIDELLEEDGLHLAMCIGLIIHSNGSNIQSIDEWINDDENVIREKIVKYKNKTFMHWAKKAAIYLASIVLALIMLAVAINVYHINFNDLQIFSCILFICFLGYGVFKNFNTAIKSDIGSLAIASLLNKVPESFSIKNFWVWVDKSSFRSNGYLEKYRGRDSLNYLELAYIALIVDSDRIKMYMLNK